MAVQAQKPAQRKGEETRQNLPPQQQQQPAPATDEQIAVQAEEVCDGPIPLAELVRSDESKFVKPTHVRALEECGYVTAEAVAYASSKQLQQVKGLSEKSVEKLQEVARQLVPMGFQRASEVLCFRQHIVRLSTGSAALDALLQGGIETGSITELIGEFKSGKSQLCHTLAVTCQIPVEQGGGHGRCIFIDTEGTFRPERLTQIAERFGLDPQAVLENVVCAKAYNTEHQHKLLTEASILMSQQRHALLIVDSATALFRAEFTGRGDLAERQQLLGKFLRRLHELADQYGCAVLITNQVVANVDSSNPFAPASKPIGGHVLAHSSQTRLFLRKGRQEQRFCKVYDSPNLPEGEAAFAVQAGGIADVPDDKAPSNKMKRTEA